MAYKPKQGFYHPLNPEKYMGNVEKIIYRSMLEARFMFQLDRDKNVTRWASEEFYVPYTIPGESFTRRYFPDLYYETRQGDKFIVEVKPYSQTLPPKRGKKKQKTFLNEQAAFVMNTCKWKAAEYWAKKHNCKFVKWTERDLNGKG